MGQAGSPDPARAAGGPLFPLAQVKPRAPWPLSRPSWAFLLAGMTIPEDDADVGQGSKYCLVAIGRLQVRAGARPSALCRRGLAFP